MSASGGGRTSIPRPRVYFGAPIETEELHEQMPLSDGYLADGPS